MCIKKYLVTFIADETVKNGLRDVGDDPYFDNLPTWGICRPNYRKSISVGDILFFLGFLKVRNQYILKGWFEVGEKINYLKALERFPNRRNVIVSRETNNLREIKWRYRDLKRCFDCLKINDLSWLKEITFGDYKLYQNPIDQHEIDNWKCRRIFHCQSKQFINCMKHKTCKKKSEFPDKCNYVVANPQKWADVSNLKITLDDIREYTGFQKSIITPRNQHNVLKFDDYGDLLIAKINEKYK